VQLFKLPSGSQLCLDSSGKSNIASSKDINGDGINEIWLGECPMDESCEVSFFIIGVAMKERCKNHPHEKAISFCFSCKEYFCSDCLDEGVEHYFCKNTQCQENRTNENNLHDEVRQSNETDNPKLLVDGSAIGFCDNCKGETNTNSISKSLFNLRRAVLVNERERCKECGSVIMDLKKPLPLIPLFWRNVATYRVIKTYDLDPDALYLHRKKFISREVGVIENVIENEINWIEIKRSLEDILNTNRSMISVETFDTILDYLTDDEYEMAFESLFLAFINIDKLPDIIDKEKILNIGMCLNLDEQSIIDDKFWEKLLILFESSAN
jgi:hypothetical protein